MKVRAEEETKHRRERQAFPDKVQQWEELFRTILETAHDKIWTLDHLGNFTFMNKRGEEAFGFEASGWRGKNITGLVRPEDLPKAQECLLNISKVEPDSCELK